MKDRRRRPSRPVRYDERRLLRIHAEHPVLILDRAACGRNIARVAEPENVDCEVCLRVLNRYQQHTQEIQRARRQAYASALLQVRDQHRAEFDAIWRTEEAARVEDILHEQAKERRRRA